MTDDEPQGLRDSSGSKMKMDGAGRRILRLAGELEFWCFWFMEYSPSLEGTRDGLPINPPAREAAASAAEDLTLILRRARRLYCSLGGLAASYTYPFKPTPMPDPPSWMPDSDVHPSPDPVVWRRNLLRVADSLEFINRRVDDLDQEFYLAAENVLIWMEPNKPNQLQDFPFGRYVLRVREAYWAAVDLRPEFKRQLGHTVSTLRAWLV